MTTAGPAFARRPLTRAACLALLTPGGHGRVAATMRAVPIIIPVTFDLVDEDICFSPGPEQGVSRAVENAVVAFETGRISLDGRADWDVHVTGVARAVSPELRPLRFRLSSEVTSGWRAAG